MTKFLQAEFSVGSDGSKFRDPRECGHGMRVKLTKRCYFCDIPLDDNNKPIRHCGCGCHAPGALIMHMVPCC